jgi:hypothetical protein
VEGNCEEEGVGWWFVLELFVNIIDSFLVPRLFFITRQFSKNMALFLIWVAHDLINFF